jgi:hypothetical protein
VSKFELPHLAHARQAIFTVQNVDDVPHDRTPLFDDGYLGHRFVSACLHRARKMASRPGGCVSSQTSDEVTSRGGDFDVAECKLFVISTG